MQRADIDNQIAVGIEASGGQEESRTIHGEDEPIGSGTRNGKAIKIEIEAASFCKIEVGWVVEPERIAANHFIGRAQLDRR